MKRKQEMTGRKKNGNDDRRGTTPVKVIKPDLVTDHADVNRCLGFMARRFCEPIQLKDLVKVSEMSRRGFSKAFLKNVGVNPGVFLRGIRIEHAKRLLVEDDLKLKEIAPRCGYRSENTFAIAFLREVKMSPKKFQRQYWLAACRSRQRLENQFKAFNRRFSVKLVKKITANFDGSRIKAGKRLPGLNGRTPRITGRFFNE
jgi:AraC-like DNA-binding protein